MDKNIFDYYSNIEEKQVDWLWFPYIPYGKITILMGDPGEGKSTFILNIIGLLTTGKDMPDGYKNSESHVVIYQCNEDSAEDTIKPRLIAADADCSKVVFIDESDGVLSFDDPRIEQVIKATGARLLVFDPIQSYCRQDTDMNSLGKMRGQLKQLSRVARDYNCAVVLIGHMNKNATGKSIYRSIGSIDIAAIARSILMVARDNDDSQIRYMYPIKSSLAKEGDAIRFKLGEGKIIWRGVCHKEIIDSFVSERKDNKEDRAEMIIRKLLYGGPVKASETYQLLEEYGISKRIVKFVKKKIGLDSYMDNNEWYWDYKEELNGRISEETNSGICEVSQVMGEKAGRS